MSSGSSGTNTVTEKSGPPAYLQNFMAQGANLASAQYDYNNQSGQPYYPGQTVVPFSDQTQTALNNTYGRAINGSPTVQSADTYAQQQLQQPIQSQFSGASNPYLDQTFNQAAQATRSQLDSQFARSGRSLDSSEAARADQLNGLATQIYGGAYDSNQNRALSDIQSQRANNLGLVSSAPGLANQDYTDLQALQGVGAQYDDLAGRQIQDQVSRYDYGQNQSSQNLDNYLARLNGLAGQSGQVSESKTPVYKNQVAGAIGGAGAGAAAGGAIGGLVGGGEAGSAAGPWGTAIGAVAGGILGAYA